MRAVVPGPLRQDVLDDLDDEFAERVLSSNRRRAVHWYWRQLLSLDALRLRHVYGSVHRRRPPKPPRADIWVNIIWQDLRYAIRMLRRTPAFTALAVATLAVGIGANVAMFTLVNGVLLKPLPYHEPDRLIMAFARYTRPAIDRIPPVLHDALAWRDRVDVLEELAAFQVLEGTLTGEGDPVRIMGQRVTANLFELLGVSPIRGRVFAADEDDSVVILSHATWQQRFGGRDIVGSQIVLNENSFTVVGVMPREFAFPPPVTVMGGGGSLFGGNDGFWIPLPTDPARMPPRAHAYFTIGRLAPGATVELVSDQIGAVTRDLITERSLPPVLEAYALPLRGQGVAVYRDGLLVLMGAVLLVLLIACVNLANLLLARAGTRAQEISVRTALGAGRQRIMGQLLTESVVLALTGGMVGVTLAVLGVRFLRTVDPSDIATRFDLSVDLRVAAFALGTTLVTGVAFGLAPAIHTSRTNLATALNTTRGRTGGVLQTSLRHALIVGQVAVALLLLTGAGLFIKSFDRLTNVDPGFQPTNLVAVDLELPETRYHDPQRIADFYRRALEQVRGLPGVEGAAAASVLPLSRSIERTSVTVAGAEEPLGFAHRRAVSPDYFNVAQIPLVNGREFTESDGTGAPDVAIVDEALAAAGWPNASPLGREFAAGGGSYTVIGIVRSMKLASLDEEDEPTYYIPMAQGPRGYADLLIRAQLPPAALSGPLREAIWSLDRDLALGDMRSMTDYVDLSVGQPRLRTQILTGFAVVALLLTTLGMYGVISYGVVQRTREIGIRVALGATGRQVAWQVVRAGLVMTGIGLAIGLVSALAFSRLVQSMLFNVAPTDPLTLFTVVLLLGSVSILAAWIPARRAYRVDPMVAMREE